MKGQSKINFSKMFAVQLVENDFSLLQTSVTYFHLFFLFMFMFQP